MARQPSRVKRRGPDRPGEDACAAAPVVGFQVHLVLEEGDAAELLDGDAFVAPGPTDLVEDCRQLGIAVGKRLRAGADGDLAAIGSEGYLRQLAGRRPVPVELVGNETEEETRVVHS